MSVNPAQLGVIKVPIKPHLKKFYLRTYHLSEPVKLEEDSILGNHVMAILQDKRSINGKEMNNLNYGSADDPMTDTLEVLLSTEMQKRSPRVSKLIRINFFLQHMFRHSVIVFIEACMKSGVNAYAACRQFLETYDYDESEYSLDGIHQIWKRHRASQLKKNRTSVPKTSNRRTTVLRG